MKLYDFNGKEFKEGLPINILSDTFESSGATYLDELPFNTIIRWSSKAGAGSVVISKPDGSKDTFSIKSDEERVFKLNKGDTAFFKSLFKDAFNLVIGNDEVAISQSKTPPTLESQVNEGDSKEIIAVKKWIENGNLGISSKTMANVFYSIPHMNKADYDAPYDPSDFKRCVDFLNAVPGSRDKIHLLSSIDKWQTIAPVWDELEDLFNQELKNKDGRMPLLYERLSSLRKTQSSFNFKFK